MTTADERLKILQMLEDGKLNADEAADLLRALGGGGRAPQARPHPEGGARFLRIQVTNLDTGTAKVNVTVPFGLVGVGLRMAERFAPEFEGVDMQELENMIASGVLGKIVEVIDEQDNERVEVYVE
jgi:hypothetical protein